MVLFFQSPRIVHLCLDCISATAIQYHEKKNSQGSDLNVGVAVVHLKQSILVLYFSFTCVLFLSFCPNCYSLSCLCLELFFVLFPSSFPLHFLFNFITFYFLSLDLSPSFSSISWDPSFFIWEPRSAPGRWFAGLKCLLSAEVN